MIRGEVICSVDDFGKNQKTNRNILKLLEMGKVDRVSIMVKREVGENEIERLIASKAKLDIHLEIPQIQKKDRKEIFGRSFSFLRNYLSKEGSLLEIRKEWISQIEKFQQLFGRLPDGLSSHEYVHFFPPYFKIICTLREKFNISYLRFGEKSILKVNTNPTSLILSFLHFFNKKHLKKGFSSDYMVSSDWIYDNLIFFKNLPKGTIEVVYHPEREEEMERIISS